MKTQILFVLVAFVYVSADSQFFCGRKLANTLAVLCPYEAASKRSGADYEALWRSGADYEGLGRFGADYEGPDRSWQRAPAEALVAKPKRGGVVSECCEKPCSIDELLTYC